MGAIEADPALLRQSAAASKHAADQAWFHLKAEIVGNVPALLETLKAEGPYGYTIMPEVAADGSIRLPIISTREGIRDCYKMVRGGSDIHSTEALIEVRGSWYVFAETVNVAQRRDSDTTITVETLALLPSSTATGITGELVWLRRPWDTLGTTPAPQGLPKDQRSVRLQNQRLHDRYLRALEAADIQGVLETYNDGVQSATRDYVDCTGFLVGLDGKQAHRSYYAALFDLYEIEAVTMLDRVVQEWYVFAELHFAVRRRADGQESVFRTAEFFIPGGDGRFIVRIGHGTDLA
jgi:hypothetical protein